MKHLNRYLSLALVLVLCLSVAACGSNGGDYYADSTMYDGVSYRVFEVDEDSLVWGDEGVYYMME